MWIGLAAALLLMAVPGELPRSAWAMDRAGHGQWCRVGGAENLPAELGGAAGVCAELEKALAPPPKALALTVLSPFLLKADVTAAGGRRLPAITVGSSDRPLSRRSLRMLAHSIAAQLMAAQDHQGRE